MRKIVTSCVLIGACAMACNRTSPTPERQTDTLEPASPSPSSPAIVAPGHEAHPANAVSSTPATLKIAPNTPDAGAERIQANVELQTVKDSKLDADAELTQIDNGVKVVLTVENGPPGKKGVHIHEKGDCSNIQGMSMGSHFAPHGEPHGLPDSDKKHPGDLGNIEIDKDGKGKLEIVAMGANLRAGDAMSFRDRAIVMHENVDKGTQPTGGAGKPIACGVISVK